LAVAALVIAALAVAATVVSGGFTSAGASRQLIANCPRGTSPADGPTADGRRACAPLGRPETFADLNTVNTQVESRDTAPFSTVAPGAYMHAYTQRQAMAAPRATNETFPWQLAGKPPLCADPTSNANICPA